MNIFDFLIDDTSPLSRARFKFLEPVENPTSVCYQCVASMCSHDLCPGDQYEWNEEHRQECDL